jgi:hypothetical protein
MPSQQHSHPLAHLGARVLAEVTSVLSSGANPENLNTDVLNASVIERIAKAANELKGRSTLPTSCSLAAMTDVAYNQTHKCLASAPLARLAE